MKENGSIPESIVQGVNRDMTGISSMHGDHEADESNRDIKYNSESDNEDDNDSDPTPGACFHQISHHTKNDTIYLNSYWILLDNQSPVHMLSSRALLADIKDADKPIDVYSSGGATHCSTTGTLNNIGEVYLQENGLAKILSYAKVKYRQNITYDDVREFLLSIHPTNGSISEGEKWGYIIITVNPTARNVTSRSCTLLKKKKKASQIEKSGMQKRQDLHTTWLDDHNWFQPQIRKFT